MSPSSTDEDRIFLERVTEAAIRLGVLGLLVLWCFQVVRPFVSLIVWGVILAVASQPFHVRLRRVLGGRNGLAATLFAILGVALIVVPMVLLSGTAIGATQALASELSSGAIRVPHPPESVSEWPVIGEWLHPMWRAASENLGEVLTKLAPYLGGLATWMLEVAAGTGLGILQFIGSIVVAGALLANEEAGARTARRIAARLSDGGASFVDLAVAAIRSVVRGILGVALIQSLLVGLGFMVAGVPGAGLWAFICMVLCVIQLGPGLVVIPVLIYTYAAADTTTAVLLTVWSVPVMLLDNVLKPVLMGRGLDAPMAVVFVGAIGGFLLSGLIGLFLGAVLLVVAYELFTRWIEGDAGAAEESAS